MIIREIDFKYNSILVVIFGSKRKSNEHSGLGEALLAYSVILGQL